MNRITNKGLKRRILEVSYSKGLSHIGSCFGAVDIIEEIFSLKGDDPFILSAGHSGLALFAVLESRGGRAIEEIWDHHNNIHPDRCSECGITASSGSLGHGLGIACGMALADRDKNVYVLVSDGELAEGANFEALRVAYDQRLTNLKLYVNANGYGAYGAINTARIGSLLRPYNGVFDITVILSDYSDFPFLKGLQAHYMTLTEGELREGLALLTE